MKGVKTTDQSKSFQANANDPSFDNATVSQHPPPLQFKAKAANESSDIDEVQEIDQPYQFSSDDTSPPFIENSASGVITTSGAIKTVSKNAPIVQRKLALNEDTTDVATFDTINAGTNLTEAQIDDGLFHEHIQSWLLAKNQSFNGTTISFFQGKLIEMANDEAARQKSIEELMNEVGGQLFKDDIDPSKWNLEVAKQAMTQSDGLQGDELESKKKDALDAIGIKDRGEEDGALTLGAPLPPEIWTGEFEMLLSQIRTVISSHLTFEMQESADASAETMAAAASIIKRFPNEMYDYIGLGGSPSTVLESIKIQGGNTWEIPISAARDSDIEGKLSSEEEPPLFLYFDHFFKPKNGRKYVLLDYSTGNSIYTIHKALSLYFKKRNLNCELFMFTLDLNGGGKSGENSPSGYAKPEGKEEELPIKSTEVLYHLYKKVDAKTDKLQIALQDGKTKRDWLRTYGKHNLSQIIKGDFKVPKVIGGSERLNKAVNPTEEAMELSKLVEKVLEELKTAWYPDPIKK